MSDLTVMKEQDILYEVNIFRPFLKLKKEDLFLEAHSNNIQYFLNTTPTWSCRGVLRDNVIPVLKKQFGDFEQNIIKFTESCKFYTEFYESNKIKVIKEEYVSKVEFSKNIINSLVIEEILLEIMHSNGYHMISNKSKKHFIEWLRIRNSQIDLNNNMFCYYDPKTNYLYFVDYKRILNEKPEKDKLSIIFNNYLPQKLKNLIY
jgi:tRNA(Ile)-lysidine synthase TilS/MesJ